MKKSRKIIKRIAYCFLAIAILLNLIWNSITCLNVDPACDYITSHALEDYTHYVPEKGDIVVFPMTWKHPLGHIAIWNGKHWVSDYKQKSIYIDEDYKGVKYIVYRNVFK